jgi:hypothetical protein
LSLNCEEIFFILDRPTAGLCNPPLANTWVFYQMDVNRRRTTAGGTLSEGQVDLIM